jgi:hypothetical protein
MSRKVLLSSDSVQCIDRFVESPKSVSSLLLYRPQGNDCNIEVIFLTGVDKKRDWPLDTERYYIAEEFFRRNPEYKAVDFHTHNQGLIHRLGSSLATGFSDEDRAHYEERLTTDPNFMAMIATPQDKKVYGRDNPTWSIAHPVIHRRVEFSAQSVIRELETIAGKIGYDIDALISRLRN